jgi:FAD binding domain/Berberine and berberine like
MRRFPGIGGVNGAVVIDMKNFQQFSMDKTTWNAVIGAGTLLDDVTKRLYNAGRRAIAHGVCPQVGTGGHLTIGGFGPMSRLWGPALDHIIAVQVVLADSSIIHASSTENPDVFFAIKGAAAGFGIVTEFTVRTHPAPEEAVRYSYSFEHGSFSSMAQAFKNWQSLASNPNLSRKLYTQVTFCGLGMIISGTFLGSRKEFDSLNLEGVFPRHDKSEVIVFQDWLGLVVHWTEDVGLHLVGGIRCAFYSKCLAFKTSNLMPSSCIDSLLHYLDKAEKGTALWFLNFELQGGATNDIPQDATAFAHRDTLLYSESFGVDIAALSPITKKFVRGINDAITTAMPNTVFGSYPGYVDPELPNGQEAYWGSNLPKLERIKRQIDPKDTFHNPQSVRPATS